MYVYIRSTAEDSAETWGESMFSRVSSTGGTTGEGAAAAAGVPPPGGVAWSQWRRGAERTREGSGDSKCPHARAPSLSPVSRSATTPEREQHCASRGGRED